MSYPQYDPPQGRDPSPRVGARSQPPAQREAFAKFYPTGLPIYYKMMQTPGEEGVQQTYLEDYLPVGFYTNPPSHAQAVFSTMNGQSRFRRLEHILPQRRIHLWNRDEIQSCCNSIRLVHWHQMKLMREPLNWDYLWGYFDAHDLYHYGVLNLWNVVNHLWDENAIIRMPDYLNATALLIGKWVDDWLLDEGNKAKLLEWDPSHAFPLVLTPQDWKSMGNVQDDALPRISSALKCRRKLLLPSEQGETTPDKAKGLLEACQNNELENWLGESNVYLNHRISLPHHYGSLTIVIQLGHEYSRAAGFPPPRQLGHTMARQLRRWRSLLALLTMANIPMLFLRTCRRLKSDTTHLIAL